MRRVLRSRSGLLIAIIVLAATTWAPGSAAAQPLSANVGGRGTATIDGVFAAGEWDGASRSEMSVNLPAFDGGGTTPGVLYLMNDDERLYMGFKVQRPSLAALVNLFFDFDNDHDGVVELGDDHVGGYAQFSTVWFADLSRQTCSWGPCTTWDTDDGGTNDVVAAASNDGVWTYVEIAHGYRQDSAHDISARPLIGLSFSLNMWSIDPAHCNFGDRCATSTRLTPGGWLDLAIVSSDQTAPAVVGALLPGPNAIGWNRGPVVVSWSVSDPESGIVSTTGCETRTVSGDTSGTILTCTATNGVGLTTSSSQAVRIDQTPPTIAYDCAATTVGVADDVRCSLTANDALSGLADISGGDVHRPAWQLGPGVHVLSATATDRAGNRESTSVEVMVTVTEDSLCALSGRFVTMTGIGTSLCAKLAAGAIDAFRHEVHAQREKALTAEHADVLTDLADVLDTR